MQRQLKGFPLRDGATGELVVGRSSGCAICTKDHDNENLLLCDVCEHEFHRECLVPPLKEVRG
jgi:hypothetical protein